jgi:hypothetical protein
MFSYSRSLQDLHGQIKKRLGHARILVLQNLAQDLGTIHVFATAAAATARHGRRNRNFQDHCRTTGTLHNSSPHYHQLW